MSHSASLDMQGFWACSDFKMQCPGLVACEKKLLSWWGFDGKLAKVKQEVQQRFAEFAQTRYGEKFTGQLLSISQLKDDAVVLTKLFYLSSPEANKWVQLHCHKPGWPSVKCSLRTFTATTGVFKGYVVASIGSFVEACGKDNKSAFKKIPQWTHGSIPGISKKSFAYMKLEQHTGGRGWVASIEVLRHIHRYIKYGSSTSQTSQTSPKPHANLTQTSRKPHLNPANLTQTSRKPHANLTNLTQTSAKPSKPQIH